jgi:predicted lipid-binding transport protein (Tim44 family)
MPLSEQEQKLLDEMERSLYHNDADFVSAVGSGRGRLNYGALVLGILMAIVGLVVVIVGVIIHLPIVGILGFVVMFVGVLVALRPSRAGIAGRSTSGPRTASSPTPAAKSGFMDRLGDRWDKRQDREE